MRKCNQCNKLKEVEMYYNQQRLKCKECVKLNARIYKSINKDRKKKKDAEYYINNKDVFKACNDRLKIKNPNYNKEYRENNRDEYNKWQLEYQRTDRYKESYYYAKTVLMKTRRLTTSETIEIKRIELKINRLIKSKS